MAEYRVAWGWSLTFPGNILNRLHDYWGCIAGGGAQLLGWYHPLNIFGSTDDAGHARLGVGHIGPVSPTPKGWCWVI